MKIKKSSCKTPKNKIKSYKIIDIFIKIKILNLFLSIYQLNLGRLIIKPFY
jgi:hypothetical protein